MIVGFTGTQHGMTREQRDALRTELSQRETSELHHGDCIGADAQAHDIAQMLGIPVILHPPINGAKRAYSRGAQVEREPADYLERNRAIVDACDLLIACPSEQNEQLRSGTWSTVRYARKQRTELLIIKPNGDTQHAQANADASQGR